MYKFAIAILLFTTTACGNPGNENKAGDSSSRSSATISNTRETVKSEAIANYDVPLKSNLNNWHFAVNLHETKERFRYLLHMKYQEVEAADTIRFPNFGQEPEPQIRKGNNDLECIIGFLDQKQQFREYIKVFVEGEQLRVKTLKHYAVTEK